MTDIIKKLEEIRPFNYNLTDDGAQVIAEEAIEVIQNLRSALREIGYDYVELSYDKVQWLYHEHMKIAKKAYLDSYPENNKVKDNKNET